MNKSSFLLIPLLFPGTLYADWYMGGNAGLAHTDVSSSELNTRLANEGLNGTASIDNSNRLGWRLFGGYQWGKYLGVEGGYTDLGHIDVSYTGTDTLTAQNLRAVYPLSPTGYELSLMGRYPFSEEISLFIRGGAFAWRSSYKESGGNVSYSGTDPLAGLGGEWRFADRWSLRLAWDRYTVAKDNTELLSLGVTYRFAEHSEPSEEKAAPPQAKETPVAPQPVAAVAPPQVEETPPAPQPVATVTPPQVEEMPPAPQPIATIALPQAEEPSPSLAPQEWSVLYGLKSSEPIEAESELAATVKLLTAHPHAVVQITGYADITGAETYNLALSRKRAEMLAAKLVAHGIAPERITIEGKGSTDPIANNGTREGRARNRRAVIVVHEPDYSRAAQQTTQN